METFKYTCMHCGIGHNVGGNHTRNCKVFIENKSKLINSFDEIVELYKNEESIVDCIKSVLHNDDIKFLMSYYAFVEKELKSRGVHVGLRATTKRTKKIQQTTIKNHGTLYISKNWSTINKIPYKKLSFVDSEFSKYSKAVQKLTAKNIKKKPKTDYCEYTGIKFGDVDGTECNPNSPIKRSIDHKIPTVWGFFNNIPVEEIAGVDNLAYVLKYVNTVKANTLYESFIPIVLKLRKIFKNEGYESN